MTYAAQETGIETGAPVELHDFTVGALTYRYTSRESAYTDTTTSPNRSYTSASIQRSAIEATQEEGRRAVKLIVPRNFAIADLFRTAPPSLAIAHTIRRVHRGDTASVNTIWVGRIMNCVFQGASAELQSESILIALKRTGLRRVYGKACAHVLYGPSCGLAKADWDAASTVKAIAGNVLSVGSLNASHNYAGGFVEWVDSDGNTQRRFIEAASGPYGSPIRNDLTLMLAFSGIAVTNAVTVYPGCDHTLATCNTTFSNALNFGGQPFFPSKNPFRGDPVF